MFRHCWNFNQFKRTKQRGFDGVQYPSKSPQILSRFPLPKKQEILLSPLLPLHLSPSKCKGKTKINTSKLKFWALGYVMLGWVHPMFTSWHSTGPDELILNFISSLISTESVLIWIQLQPYAVHIEYNNLWPNSYAHHFCAWPFQSDPHWCLSFSLTSGGKSYVNQ
jgi:hypothetical protein